MSLMSSFYKLFNIKKKLKGELLLFILPIVIIPSMLVGIASYTVSSKILLNNTIKSTADLQTQINLSIRYALSQIDSIMDTPLHSEAFTDLCRSSNSSSEEAILNDNDKQINNFIAQQIFYSNSYIHSVIFILSSGKVYYKDSDTQIKHLTYEQLSESDWYKNLLGGDGSISWKALGQREYIASRDTDLLVNERLLLDPLTLKPLGVFVLNIDSEILYDQYKSLKLEYNGLSFILNGDGTVISHSYQDKTGTKLDDEIPIGKVMQHKPFYFINGTGASKKLVVSSPINPTEWTLVSIYPYDSLMLEAQKIKWLFVIIIIASTITVIMFSLKFISKIASPINSLITSMNQVKSGNLNVSTDIKSYEEIDELSDNFNNMTRHIQNLINDVYEVEASKHTAEIKAIHSELKALQAQINPHFIYNTLETVNVMAKIKHEQEISSLVTSLAKFLRISLSRGKEIITIGQELDMIKEYMNIQNINCNNRFKYDFLVDKSLLDYSIVKFTLQPLVENSIYHGFCEIEYLAEITIRCFEEDSSIIFKIRDNGKGMSDNKINQLNAEINYLGIDENINDEGFGIKNVSSRIKLFFGKQYGLSYEKNEVGGGVTVTVTIPKSRGI